MKKLLPCTALVMCAGMACAQAEERNDWHFNIGAMYEIENVEGYGEDPRAGGHHLAYGLQSILMPPTGRGELLWPIIRKGR